MSKKDMCVVRNQAYRRSEFNIRERHNDRKNENYYNGDIIKDQSINNVYFKTCPGTYEQEFYRMVDSGEISLRGLQANAKVFDELIFGVNSDYFERNGGYEYAKQFFSEAYNLAVEEAGGEEYILSAVMHADERNKALSEQYGRDVFHYHLHVIYVPIVEKKVYFRKNNKDPNLAGKLREVIKQVSHSKKWPRFKDETGRLINSYSLLQDRFHEHMKTAGYDDIERGERGSTAEHLSVIEFKTLKESERVTIMTAEADKKQKAVDVLDQKADKKQAHLDKLDEQIVVKKKSIAKIEDIDNMGKPALLGGINLTVKDFNELKTLAKRSINDRSNYTKMKKERDKAVAELAETKKKIPSIADNLKWGKFISALKRAPKRLMEVIEDILRKPPEKNTPELSPVKSKNTEISM